jgi:hypothetical protein
MVVIQLVFVVCLIVYDTFEVCSEVVVDQHEEEVEVVFVFDWEIVRVSS